MMSFPSRDPQPPSGERASDVRPPHVQADEEKSLLDEVLRQTEQSADERDTADRAVWGRLLEVAQRHSGEPFGLEPVLVEMVDASLQSQFGTEIDPETRRSVCRRIAQTLFDDPTSRERLELLWNHISARRQDR